MMRATSGIFQVNGWSIVKLKVENHDRLHWISSQFKSDLFSTFIFNGPLSGRDDQVDIQVSSTKAMT